MSMLQIGIIGIAGSIMAIIFQQNNREYSVIIGIGVAVLIFGSIMSKVEVIVSAMNQIQGYMKMEVEYIEVILKMLGITYIAEFASDVCKDCGYGNVATQIQLFGKVSILALSMPVLLALLETIRMFLG